MAKKLPKVSVLDRRRAHPFGAPSQAITLKTPGQWMIRTVNSNVRSGRIYDMIHNKGWVYVQPEELDGSPDELGFQVKDGRIVRGTNGEEVLMKIPQADYDAIQEAKARTNLKGLGKKQALEAAANLAGKTFGDQAGDTVSKASFDIEDSREAVELEPDLP